jgi:hypothetical protein
MNKRLSSEIKQANEREKEFLNLLKNTSDYGKHSNELERAFKAGKSETDLVNESGSMSSGFLIKSDGFKRPTGVPPLDLSKIHLKRELEQESSTDAYEDDEDYMSSSLESAAKQFFFDGSMI